MRRCSLLLHLARLVLWPLAILAAGTVRAEELRLIARYQIQGTFRHITGFDIDGHGNLLVADSEAPAVVRIDTNGKRIGSYAQAGRRYCEIAKPTAVAATTDGFVLFDFARQHLLRFGRNSECQSDDLLRTFQTDGGLKMIGSRLVGAGSLMNKKRGERCVFFSTDSEASVSSATCLLTI